MTRPGLACASALLLMAGCAPEPSPIGERSEAEASGASQRQPNFLLLVADDMGYTDIGAFGGEIATPTLDDLAARSLKLTNFHVLPMCAPTRSMLLSGTDNHTAGLGAMFGGDMLTNIDGRTGYERYFHERVATLPELLADAGYHTYMAGKWHLGEQPDQMPHARGFEQAFALLRGSGPHDIAPADRYVERGAHLEEDITDFYSTRDHTDKLIEYIAASHGDGRPFFAYAAYTSPHWPLQAPDDFIDRYAGRYDDGFDALREERYERARSLGVVPDVDAESGFQRIGPAWDELSEEERRVSARKMEIYAAMVENLDFHIGRLIDYLEGIGELDRTIILFMSDNGAESDDIERNPTFVQRFQGTADNSYDNLGRPGSYVSYGPGWAQAASAPFNRFKAFINEGGTRVPAFVLHGAGTNQTGIDNRYLGAIDVAPTLLELAGADSSNGIYRGREVADIEGRSFARILDGDDEPIYSDADAIAMELHGGRSLRRGRYKLVWEQPPANVWWNHVELESWYRWQLFDVENDPGESTDLSRERPELVNELAALWDDYAETHGVVRDVRLRAFERWLPARARN